MPKSETLQLRINPDEMLHLRKASDAAGLKMSDFVRRLIEPAIVASKIADIAGDYGYITSVKLFGSMARGDHEATSDIDIAVETDGPYKWMGERGMGRFVGRLEEATGRSVDVVKAKYCGKELAAEIERDGKLVYER